MMYTQAVKLLVVTLGLCHAYDFRNIAHNHPGLLMANFTELGVTSYAQLLFDIPRHTLIVGARDSLLRLSLDTLGALESVPWPSSNKDIDRCKEKGQSEADCRNFVTVLLSHGGKVFACGTNSFSPNCTWREIDSLSTVTEVVSGAAKCAYSPHQNMTALITTQGDYYIASVVDFQARDPAIYRIMGKSGMLRTARYDSKWLYEPSFVGSYEIGNFVYFFFRETALEYTKCGKAVYSRVARVCKNDAGGQYILRDSWSTFIKARLNCSVPGEFPFYYNEIQSVFYLEQSQMVYATFTTPTNSIYGTAVCAFNMSSIAKAFLGPFKHQSSSGVWETYSNDQRHFQCEPSSGHRVQGSERFQLTDESVQPVQPHPIYQQELERFSHITVDVVATKHAEEMHVIYVATTDGVVKKLSILPRTRQTCLVEILNLFPPGNARTIRQMKVLKDLKSLYIGTNQEVIKISVERCGRFESRTACLNARDPYCGWNSHMGLCSPPPKGNPLHPAWEQNIISCPDTTQPVNGGWTEWGPWHVCSHVGKMAAGDNCLCRSRSCSNPEPANNGTICEGPSNQVTNCTQDGQWTEWSAWSACTQSCGLAVKRRRRVCGNPEPAFGGASCDGPGKDEIYCTTNPPCPVPTPPPVDGHWSEWSEWETCSVHCGKGFRSRKRRCDNPPPSNGGRECYGGDMSYELCNHEPCMEQRKNSQWTPWLRGNSSANGYFEQRYKVSCRAYLPDVNMMRTPTLRKEERFCLDDGTNCYDPAYINNDGEWSEWSPWTPCSAECGGGNQYRERRCDNPQPVGAGLHCQGDPKEERVCNLQPCADASNSYSCWSEWSSCSKRCGKGVISRVRDCLGGHECLLPLETFLPCTGTKCSNENWGPWTDWTECDSNSEQSRERFCETDSCEGESKQTRNCSIRIQEHMMASVSGASFASTVIGSCIASFLFGAAVGGTALFCFTKHRKRRNTRMFQSQKVNQNIYNPIPERNNSKYKNSPYKEATIKRNGGPVRVNLEEDTSFT